MTGAFALFKGTCSRGIYDNMKTAVEAIFVGKGRLYNRRFIQMRSHYLVDVGKREARRSACVVATPTLGSPRISGY